MLEQSPAVQSAKDEIINELLKDLPSENAIEVELPSECRVYKLIDPEQGITIRPMTFEDEKVLVSKKRGRKKTGQNDGQFKADVVLYGAKDLVLKRLFHMFRIHQCMSNEDFTFFDVWNNYENQINKRPLVQIKIIKEDNISDENFKRTKTNIQDYESQIRMTQRDVRQAKILILNLCKGQFPITDKLI